MSSPTITVRTPRDIIDYINDHPTGTGRTRLLAIIALGGVFVDAYDFTSLGLGIGSLTKQWSLDPLQVGLLTSVMAFGALVGSILGFYIFPLLLASLGLAGTMGWLTVIPAVGLIAVVLIKWNPLAAEVEDETMEVITR